jgi:hypothetical protein
MGVKSCAERYKSRRNRSKLDGVGKQDAVGAAIAVLVDDKSVACWMERVIDPDMSGVVQHYPSMM